jgi:hypothetical protein
VSKLKPLFKPWHFIVLGISLTVLAAVLNHFSIETKYAELTLLRDKITNLDSRIDSLWQRNIEAERKKDLAALFSDLSTIKLSTSVTQPIVTQYIDSIQDRIPSQKPLPILSIDDNDTPHTQKNITDPTKEQLSQQAEHQITQIESHQQYLQSEIDDLYFDKINLEKQQMPIEINITLTRNISLFLQLLGLILVLSRDLVRKD